MIARVRALELDRSREGRWLQTQVTLRNCLVAISITFAPCVPAQAQTEAMRFTPVIDRKCVSACPLEVFADGWITAESADSLRDILRHFAAPRLKVILASPGGSLTGSLQLGGTLRDHAAAVYVQNGTACVSACVYAFLGGKTRQVEAKAKIGVHAFHAPEHGGAVPAVLAQYASTMLVDYVSRMGADPALVTEAMQTPPGTMRFLNTVELRRWRVVNR